MFDKLEVLPNREHLSAHGVTLIRNGGNYEEYTLDGHRFACGWSPATDRWMVRELKPLHKTKG